MSLLLGQLIYTSFPGVGFRVVASTQVSIEIQQAFIQRVVNQYWNPYNPPEFGYRAAYLHQLTSEHNLFGWLYNDGLDDLNRSHVPYFVCYHLAGQLYAAQLENIFAYLNRGPVTLIERRVPAILQTIVVPDLQSYQPACVGVTIPADVRERGHTELRQRRLLDLFIPVDQGGIVNGDTNEQLERSQRVLKLNNVSEVSSMTQPSPSQPDQSKANTNDASQGNADQHTTKISNHPSPLELISVQQAGQAPGQLESHQQDLRSTTDKLKQIARQPQPSHPQQQGQREWSLKAKTMAWALAVSVLPVLAVGTATYYFGSQSITKQITQARQAGTTVAETEALQRQLPLLLIGTGMTAALAGAIAAFLANRITHPVVSAAAASNKMVNRLRREEVSSRDRVAGKDELAALETNLNLIEGQLPDLLWKQEAEAERSQVLLNIIRRIRESLSEEDVLRTGVREIRQAFRTDRVVVFRFDSNWDGTFVEESVAPGWPKTLWATVSDPCFEGGYVEQYRNGRVRAIDDIHQAGLNDCHVGLLERFAVKANLIAPIVRNNQLFGLLIAHQCSSPRFWQQPEIDLFAQLATQVGFALDYARLLERLDTKAAQAQVSIDITRNIRQSLIEEDVLKTTVEEVRKALITDRVIVYCFDADWYGTVVAESVVPGFPKALRATIKDPCFEEGYVDKYQAGRVQATNNIYEAGLTECHLRQLEPFAVKANLVAPILKDDKLFGLLIAHECSGPRAWQQPEINLFAQLAMQVGFALDHARLLTRVDAEGVGIQLLADLTRRIRESLIEEDILKTTVEEVRKAIRTDRVIVYCFDADWYGTVVAESVVPGWPKALWAEIKDPCFEEGYVDKYQAGRVQATNNIYEAGLTECHLRQLEPFAVKANLVAPILKDDKLFGLLIAHECSGPRAWQQPEINLFAQLAMQVGFALDHARLLDQVEQAYQLAAATSHEQRQQKEVLQRQVSELLRDSETAIATLSTEALSQIESVTVAYNQIQAAADSARSMTATVQQVELKTQQADQTVQAGHQIIGRAVENISAIRESFIATSEKLKRLDRPSQKLSEVVGIVSSVASQIKLQAMSAALEAARTGEAGQAFVSIAEKVQSLARRLDTDLVEIKPLVAEIQTGTHEVAAAMGIGTQQVVTESHLVEEAQQRLNQIATFSAQMNTLAEELVQATAGQVQISTSASQSVLQVASLARQTSEQSLSVVESFTKLAATAQELQAGADQLSDS